MNLFLQFLQFYRMIILIRILMTWVRLDPSHPVVAFLLEVTDPYLRWIKAIVPPRINQIGMLDLTPIYAFLFLDLVAMVAVRL